MSFKKFEQFINEKKKEDKKDIEAAVPETPPIDPSISLKCPKCGESTRICDCYIDDYYNAKNPQFIPKGKVKKKKDEQNPTKP